MANALFPGAVQRFGSGDLDWDANRIVAILVDIANAGPGAGAYVVSTHDNNNTATITTSATHGVVAGDRVTFKGQVDTIPAVAVSTAYGVGAVVRTAANNVLRAIKGGTSAGSAPTYPTAIGDVVMDGTVAWVVVDTAANVGSILNLGSWQQQTGQSYGGFNTGYWTVNTAPTGTTFTISLPTGTTLGTQTTAGFFANLSKTAVSTFAPSAARVGGTGGVLLADANKTNLGGVVSYNTAITWTAVTGATVEGVLIAKTNALTASGNDASDANWVPVAWYDSLTNLPVTPNGGDITFNISPNLFTL